jgi:hypothetical protein
MSRPGWVRVTSVTGVCIVVAICPPSAWPVGEMIVVPAPSPDPTWPIL